MGLASGSPAGALLTRPATVSVVFADRARPAERLSTVDDIAVLGQAATGAEAVRAVLRHRPDVLVFDPELARELAQRNGIGVIREVLCAAPATAVLVVTARDDDDAVRAAIQAGARGYLIKGAEEAGLPHAIRSVAAGEVIFGATIACRIATLLAGSALGKLTAREREIYDLLCSGLSNSGIAQRLHLAPKTIRNNLSAIFAKLGVADRAEAIANARL
jgi:DNA-binding NarL/FixJ family response regulator